MTPIAMPIDFRRLPSDSAITVNAPARLHLGFLDPAGSLGRPFGSLGLVIDTIGTTVTMRAAEREHIDGKVDDGQRQRIVELLATLREAFGARTVAVDVGEIIAPHCGLGSGTQLALALGTAYARLVGRHASTAELAQLLGRGRRSGIGVTGFGQGGLLLDGGPGRVQGRASGDPLQRTMPGRAPQQTGAATPASNQQPPLLSRFPFPDTWRVLLIRDPSRQGLHGDAERRALAALAPFPRDLAAHLCHLAVMCILPGAAQTDFEPFAHGVSELQRIIGEYFSPAQGGVFTSAAIGQVMAAIGARHLAGIGQSSWGPTAFAILPSAAEAEAALATATAAAGAAGARLDFALLRGRNHGATITAANEAAASAGEAA
jgi:beta-RFAP synthase